MNRIIVSLCLLVWGMPIISFAQWKTLTNAEQGQLRQLTSDVLRVDTLNEWAYQTEGQISQKYATAALEIGEKINYNKGKADSYVRLGSAKQHLGEVAAAKNYFKQAITLRTQLKDTPGVAGCYVYLGNLKKNSGDYESAIADYKYGLKIMEQQPLHVNTPYLFNSLGTAYRHLGLYDSVVYNFKNCLAYYSQLPATTGTEQKDIQKGRANVRMNMAAFLQDNLQQYQTARDTLNKCLADYVDLKDTAKIAKCYFMLGNNAYYTGNNKEALRYYDQALSYRDALSREDRAKTYKNKGRVYLDLRKYNKSVHYFQTSLDSFSVLENQSDDIAEVHFELGNYYYERDSYKNAIEHYNLSADSAATPLKKIQALYFLSDALFQAGRKEAADSIATKYIQSLHELNNDKTAAAFEKMMLYQLDKNQTHKTLLKKEKQRMATYSIVAIAVLTLLITLLYLIYRQKIKLAKQNEEIAINEKIEIIQNREMETTYARLEAQEEMQQQIGRELHDNVGAMLATVKINLSTVDELLDKLPLENRRTYESANKLLDDTCEEVRRISHELTSAVLTRFGLKAQLEALADVIPRSGKLQVELTTHGLQERLEYRIELNIYRIVQELVTNVIKHAGAKHLTIQVNRFEEKINITVEDDGKGFNMGGGEHRGGIGFHNLRSRVYDLHGEIQIDSQIGHGTSVFIDIPMTNS